MAFTSVLKVTQIQDPRLWAGSCLETHDFPQGQRMPRRRSHHLAIWSLWPSSKRSSSSGLVSKVMIQCHKMLLYRRRETTAAVINVGHDVSLFLHPIYSSEQLTRIWHAYWSCHSWEEPLNQEPLHLGKGFVLYCLWICHFWLLAKECGSGTAAGASIKIDY
jgi:hypothetical protein